LRAPLLSQLNYRPDGESPRGFLSADASRRAVARARSEPQGIDNLPDIASRGITRHE
jgi:hypothetical protein